MGVFVQGCVCVFMHVCLGGGRVSLAFPTVRASGQFCLGLHLGVEELGLQTSHPNLARFYKNF